MSEEVGEIMCNARTSSLSNLVSALHRAGWSYENTPSQVSFYEHTSRLELQNISTENVSSSFRINSLEMTGMDDSPSSTLSIRSDVDIDVDNWFEFIERKKSQEFFKPTVV